MIEYFIKKEEDEPNNPKQIRKKQSGGRKRKKKRMNKIKKEKEKNNEMWQKCRTEEELDKNKNGKMTKMKRTNQQRNVVRRTFLFKDFVPLFFPIFFSIWRDYFLVGQKENFFSPTKSLIFSLFNQTPILIIFSSLFSPSFFISPLFILTKRTLKDKTQIDYFR